MDQHNPSPSVPPPPPTGGRSPSQNSVEYPVRLEVAYPASSSRLLALASILLLIPKLLLLVPHFIILYALGFAGFVAFIIAQFAVLFTGTYPRNFFDFIVGTQRWQARVNAYFLGLTDIYPPFSLH